MSPVAAICHVLAIAAGAWGGYTLMAAAAPDPPPPEVEPAVSTDPTAEPASPSAPESFLRAFGFASGLSQLSDQMEPDEQIRVLHIEPGTMHVEGGVEEEGGLIPIEEIPGDATENIVDAIHEQRPEISYDQIRSMELVATKRGPRWYVQIVIDDPDVTPPWTYSAPLAGFPVKVGGAPPVPVGQ